MNPVDGLCAPPTGQTEETHSEPQCFRARTLPVWTFGNGEELSTYTKCFPSYRNENVPKTSAGFIIKLDAYVYFIINQNL